MSSNIKVLYHKNCLDGFTASWVAHKKFGEDADYIPVVHQMPIPGDLEDKEVYLLDFVYSKEEMEEIQEKARKVTAIDHHKSVKEVTKSLSNHLYDAEHSGAVLAWQYFYPDEEVPRFLKIVEDMDLWNLEFKETEPIIAYLETIEFDYGDWSKLIADFEDESKFQNYLKKGELILEYKEALVDRLIDKAEKVKFEGYEVLAVNSPLLVSEVGNKLYKKKPPFSIIWYRSNGILIVSLRSDGNVDIGEIAKKYGGGGNPGAAGFKFPRDADLPWEVINKENNE